MNDTTISVAWDNDRRILSTRLAGVLSPEDVQSWKDSLQRASRQIPKDSVFKMLIDIRGYEVADQDRQVHQVMREVTPLFLASHGFRVGFFDLYQVEPPVSRGDANALCIAVAHVHHDCSKMERYNELLGTSKERFFCDVDDAEAWLKEAARAPAGGV